MAAGRRSQCASPQGRRSARFLFNPELRLGEAYMDGTFVVEQGSIADVLAILFRQERLAVPTWALPWRLGRYLFRRMQQFNPRSRSRRNVAHHYDLDGRLYTLFLDADQQYSCAYFETPDQSLDDAQLAKKRHLAAKLRVEPGASGARHRLRLGRPRALSRRDRRRARDRHHAFAGAIRARATAGGRARPDAGCDLPAGRLSRRRRPFRPHRLGRHVRACRRRLLRHVLPQVRATPRQRRRVPAAYDRPQRHAERHQSVDRQIHFPRRLHPCALGSPARHPARRASSSPTSKFCNCHYAETLKAWRERFLAHREDVERLYDARFVRMWEFYLASSEMAFRESDMVVFQIQITKRKGVVPQTRDYIGREEARLRALEAGYSRAAAPRRRIARRRHEQDAKASSAICAVTAAHGIQWVAGKAAIEHFPSGRRSTIDKSSWFVSADGWRFSKSSHRR